MTRSVKLHFVKRAFILISCAAFALCNDSAVRADAFSNPSTSWSGKHPAVVRVAVAERGGAAYGSGSLVAVDDTAGLILTNWHVVRDAAGSIVVEFPNGFRSGAYLLRTDREWDLAALAVRRPPGVRPIPISTTAPRPGDSLTIIGYGSGSYLAQTGRCTQYVSPGGNQPFEMVELSAPARNGDSGGPILNTRGELVGVLFGSAFGRTTGSYCGRLHGFVASVNADFHRISNQAMLADRARRGQTPTAIEATPTGLAVTSSAWQPTASNRAEDPMTVVASTAPPARLATLPERTPLPAGSTLPSPTVNSTVVAMSPADAPPRAESGGQTCAVSGPVAAVPPPVPIPLGDQAKTLLALIGVFAVLYHALRLLGTAIG